MLDQKDVSTIVGDLIQPSNLTGSNVESALLSATLDAVSDAVIIFNINSRITRINTVAQQLTGWPEVEALNRPIHEVVDLRDAQTRQAVFSAIYESMSDFKLPEVFSNKTLNYFLVARGGSELSVNITCSPIVDNTQVKLGFVLVLRVVDTVSKNQLVGNDNQRFFSLSQEMLCTAGFDGFFKKLNSSWEKVLDYSLDELLAKPFIEFVHPDDQEITRIEAKKLMSGKDTVTFENRYCCKDGSVRWLLWSTVSVVEEQLLYASARDITERKKIEQALQIHTEQFEYLINAAPFGIYLIDGDFSVLQVNPYALPSFGDTPNLIGRDFGEVIHMLWPAPKAEEIVKLFKHTLQTGEPSVVPEMIEQRADHGATEYYAWEIHRIPLPNGKHGVVCYFQDISQRVLAQQKIRNSEWRLRYATESAKLTFVEVDLATGAAYTPENFEAVMGYASPPAQETDGAIGAEALLKHVVPDDRPLVQASLDKFFNGEPVGKIDYRVLGDDHIERWIESKWSIEAVLDGNPTKSFATNLDITERKLAELARTKIEERYRTLFNCMDEGYCVVEMIFDAQHKPIDYRFLEVNPPFEEQSGLVNATGKTILELIPDFDPIPIAIYGQVAITGEPIRFEYEVEELERWFDLYAFRIKSVDNNKIAILFTNITERKQAEQALKASEERLQAFVMNSSDLIYSMSADWRLMHQLEGRNFVKEAKKSNSTWLQDNIYPDDQLAVQARIKQVIQTKSIFEMEHRILRFDNTVGWTLSRAVPLLNKQGDITEWFGTATDITERKKAQEALRQSEKRFSVLFDLGPVAMYTVDAAGTIQEFNRNAVAMWGREPQRGDPSESYCCAYKIYTPDGTLVPHAKNTVADVLEGRMEAALDVEAILERVDGSRVNVVANVVPLKNEQGDIVGAMSCLVDMTYRKNVEDLLVANNLELQTAKLIAEKSNLAKSEFLSSMSHELRTPLNSILGFAQLIESGATPLTLTQTRNIHQILKAGWYLLELINEILDLAQIESGQQALLLEPVMVQQAMQECLQLMQPQTEKYGVEIDYVTIDPTHHVLVDKTRLKQIFINLLSNAIKYNKVGGSVIVAVSQANDVIRISVKDTGLGLDESQLAQLFQPFNRLGKKTNPIEGTGIGLVVSKRLVELMQGNIGVQSTVDVGSEFWVEFKLIINPAPKLLPSEPELLVN